VADIQRGVVNHGLVPLPVAAQLWELRQELLLGLELRHHGWPCALVPSGPLVVVNNKCLPVELLEFAVYRTWLKNQIRVILPVLQIASRPHRLGTIVRQARLLRNLLHWTLDLLELLSLGPNFLVFHFPCSREWPGVPKTNTRRDIVAWIFLRDLILDSLDVFKLDVLLEDVPAGLLRTVLSTI
jgi:hypothetical protein